jgi:hypothetical protein
MKATFKKVLKSSVAFSVLCSSVVACNGGGGGGGGYNSNNVNRPSNVAQRPVVRPRPNVVTARPALQTQPAISPTPAAPVARISEVPATEAPAANLQLAPAVPEVEPKVASPEPPKAADDSELKKTLDAIHGGSDVAKDEESAVSDAMKGLLGTWMAVSRQGEGELSTIELQLDDNGTAKLTVPGKDGKSNTTTRKVNFDNKELKLIGGDSDITLGKLVEFDARQMVLDRDGRQVTFVRPN